MTIYKHSIDNPATAAERSGAPVLRLTNGSLTGTTEAGFTLVELMVGVVIGLLATVVIFQVFAVSESQKRTTTSGSDAEQNGAFAMHNLETNLRLAGNNITNSLPANVEGNPVPSQITGCRIPAAPPYTQATLRAIPVLITDGGGGAADTISVFTGNATALSSSVGLDGDALGGATIINVRSTVGFTPGDLVLVAESQAESLGKDCVLRAVTPIGVNPAPAPPAVVSAGKGSITVTATTAALPSGYTKDGAIFNLGPAVTPTATNPSRLATAYSVYNNQLIATDLTQGTQAAFPAALNNYSYALADQVVNIQAQYGVDTSVPADGIIDAWVEPTGVWSVASLTPTPMTAAVMQQITQIRAVRLGLVVRSSQVERADSTGVCVTTPNLNLPFPLSAVPAVGTMPAKPQSPNRIDTTNLSTPNCYRYKTYDTVIPIRNPIWSDSNIP